MHFPHTHTPLSLSASLPCLYGRLPTPSLRGGGAAEPNQSRPTTQGPAAHLVSGWWWWHAGIYMYTHTPMRARSSRACHARRVPLLGCACLPAPAFVCGGVWGAEPNQSIPTHHSRACGALGEWWWWWGVHGCAYTRARTHATILHHHATILHYYYLLRHAHTPRLHYYTTLLLHARTPLRTHARYTTTLLPLHTHARQ